MLVAVERRGRGSGRVRMGVMPNFRATTLTRFLTQRVRTFYLPQILSPLSGQGYCTHVPLTGSLNWSTQQIS